MSTIPKSIRWQKLVLLAAIAVVALVLGAIFSNSVRGALAGVGRIFGFGHKESDELVAVTDESGKIQYYTCGMHPWVILPAPGDCPICHMKLTPIDPDKFTGEITIDPVVVQNMGVRIAPVSTGPLTRTIRTVGTVDYDETTVRDVNVKISGWIEKLHVDFLGAEVKKGEPLFELYSPQLYASQKEYLLAWRNRNKPSSANLIETARTRLKYFDITDEQIAELQKANKPNKTMTILSPWNGVVISKHANEGMKVDTGMLVFRIADLSKVWVQVTLYEYQLPYVTEGMKALMSLPYVPGQTFEGKVLYIYPYLDVKKREVQVRLEFENPAGVLKPGMFANVQIKSTLAAEKTLAPRSAIIDTGERQISFVSLGEGKFEPRDVKIGVTTGNGDVEIISGLKPGEMVVTSGQFLLDSEANIREALAKMIRGDQASEQKASAEVAGATAVKKLPEPVAASLEKLLTAYFSITDTMADDKTEGVAENARTIAAAIDEMIKTEIPDAPHFWHKHEEAIAQARGAALELAQAADLKAARLQLAELSTSLEPLVLATGIPPSFGKEVQLLHCPMYRSGQGGTDWLQPAGEVRNPYYGSKMLGCFDERKTIPTTGE